MSAPTTLCQCVCPVVVQRDVVCVGGPRDGETWRVYPGDHVNLSLGGALYCVGVRRTAANQIGEWVLLWQPDGWRSASTRRNAGGAA